MMHKFLTACLFVSLAAFVTLVSVGKTAVSTSITPSIIPTTSWQTLPGPTGGSVADIVLSPAYPASRTLFAGLRGPGVYRSDDDGFSWQPTGSGDWVIVDLAISPDFAADETLFALYGLWTTGFSVHWSQDGGETWQPTASPTSFPTARRLAVSPDFAHDQLLYLASGSPGLTYVSGDGGETFAAAGGWFASHPVNELVFSPAFAADRTLFALAAGDGIYRSTDAGVNWLPVETSRSYSALAVSPDYATDQTLAAVAVSGTIFVSTDDGVTWNAGSGMTLGAGGQTTLAFSPTFAADQVIMAASSTDASPVRSLDGGVNWEPAGPYDPAQSYQDGMIGGDVLALALAPEQNWDGVVFAAASSGVARSPSRGNGWMQMNDGLPQLSVRSLALAPDNPAVMLAGTEFFETLRFDTGAAPPADGNLHWSLDGGQNWRHVSGRLARVNEVAFSPAFASDKTAFAAAGMIGQHGFVEGGVYRTADSGVSWTAVFPHTLHAFHTLALSPNFAADQTVWASANTYSGAVGLFRSTNGGDSWTNIAPGKNIQLLSVSYNYAADHTLFAGMGGDGVQRSVDGGVTWTRTLDTAFPTALAISPAYGSSRTVYAAARPDPVSPTAVYRSTNGGVTWQALATGIPTEQNGAKLKVSALAFAVDGSVLAGVQYGESGGETAVYRSADSGVSWQIVGGSLEGTKLYDFASAPAGSFTVWAAADAGIQQITISQGAAAEPGVWHTNGPRGGGAKALAVSPAFASDGIAFTGEWFSNYQGGEAGTRIVKSTNFGQNWAVSAAGTAEMGNETAVHDYAFSDQFAADRTVFAATGGGLFQSVDGGVSWTRNEALYQGPPGIINDVAAAPDFAASGHLMATGGYGGLFVSQDGGGSWDTVHTNLVNSLAYSPAFAADDTAFVAELAWDGSTSVTHVAKTTDGGAVWTPVYTAAVTSLAVSPAFASDQTVFAGGADFHISADGGMTWVTRTVAADIYTIWSLVVSPNYAVDQTLFAGTSRGLYHSADGGDSWRLVPGYENTTIPALAIAPDWPTHAVLLVGTSTGVYRLLTADLDTGETRQATQGLITLSASVMALTADDSLLLAGTGSHGLYASADEGQTWTAYGLNGGSMNADARALAFSPDYASDQTVFAAYGSKYTGYYRSTDAGATWENLLGIYTSASIAVSPDFANDQTVFVTGPDSGEFQKSTDGGDSWQQLTTWDWTRGGSLIALPPDYPANGRLFVGSGQGFWYSPDDGATWQQASSGLGDEYSVFTLRVSPAYAADQTLLALASWSGGAPDYTYYRGVFRSTDGGVNWLPVMIGLPVDGYWTDVAFSPHYLLDQTAYALSADNLYRSLDGGASWTVVGQPPGQPRLARVLVDSQGRVFVSTSTGVWRYNTLAQDVIVNGRFEANNAWDLPTTPIPANYSTQVVYNGRQAMRVGLDNGPHVSGFSSARQTFTLPADPLLARLTFYLYPISGEETAVPPPTTNPMNLTAGDAQYAYLYDGTGSTHLETLTWDLSNGQAWQKYTADLSAYGGQELMLHFGVKNDGLNGMTGMYVDDVSLLVMDGSLYPHRVYLPVVVKQ